MNDDTAFNRTQRLSGGENGGLPGRLLRDDSRSFLLCVKLNTLLDSKSC